MNKSVGSKTIVLLILIFFGCEDKNRVVVEPMGYGDYFITNNSTHELIINATAVGSHDPVALLDSITQVGLKTHFYTFAEGSGGHVYPSNAFDSFNISIIEDTIKVLKFSRVNDQDWKNEGTSSAGHMILTLIISDSILNVQ